MVGLDTTWQDWDTRSNLRTIGYLQLCACAAGGAGLFRLVNNCLSRETCFNSFIATYVGKDDNEVLSHAALTCSNLGACEVSRRRVCYRIPRYPSFFLHIAQEEHSLHISYILSPRGARHSHIVPYHIGPHIDVLLIHLYSILILVFHVDITFRFIRVSR